jgi:hypothetical protein
LCQPSPGMPGWVDREGRWRGGNPPPLPCTRVDGQGSDNDSKWPILSGPCDFVFCFGIEPRVEETLAHAVLVPVMRSERLWLPVGFADFSFNICPTHANMSLIGEQFTSCCR